MATLRPRTPTTRHHHTRILRSQTDPSRLNAAHYDNDSAVTGPWQHMAQTYAWVVEQEYVKLEKHNKKTGQWVLEQQIFLSDGNPRNGKHGPKDETPRGKMWEEMMYAYEVEAERWMRHEEEARRVAAEREKEKARIIQEDIRRIEARIRQKRDAEKRRLAEERSKVHAGLQEREKKDKAKADKATIDAWRNYEERWNAIAASTEPLTFSTIPWPVISPPAGPESITCAGIILFLFSPLHSRSQSRKDRIRSAQLRWHPDRFRRLLGRVEERDKDAVEEGVGIVARCLNDLMARETVTSRHQTV